MGKTNSKDFQYHLTTSATSAERLLKTVLQSSELLADLRKTVVDQSREQGVIPQEITTVMELLLFGVSTYRDPEDFRTYIQWVQQSPKWPHLHWANIVQWPSFKKEQLAILISVMPDPTQLMYKGSGSQMELFWTELIRKSRWDLLDAIQQGRGLTSWYPALDSPAASALTPLDLLHEDVQKILSYDPHPPADYVIRALQKAYHGFGVPSENIRALIDLLEPEVLTSLQFTLEGSQVNILGAILLGGGYDTHQAIQHAQYLLAKVPSLLTGGREMTHTFTWALEKDQCETWIVHGQPPLVVAFAGFLRSKEEDQDPQFHKHCKNVIRWLLNAGAPLDSLPADWSVQLESIDGPFKVEIEKTLLKRELKGVSLEPSTGVKSRL